MLAAKVIDSLLCCYGRFVPYHPERWRVTKFLKGYAAPTWDGTRLITRHGIRFEVDPHDFVVQEILYNNEQDPYSSRYARSVVRPGEVVVDAGAHIGWFSLLFSRLVGSTGIVHAFEPAEETRAKLRRNIELNDSRNVQIYALALGDEVTQVRIRRMDKLNTGANRVSIGAGEIGMTTLDNLGLERLDFLKADIEGCEGKLLRGGRETIQKFRPKMILEVNPSALADFGDSAERLIAILRDWDYQVFVPTWRGLRELHEVPRAPEYLNIVAEPK